MADSSVFLKQGTLGTGANAGGATGGQPPVSVQTSAPASVRSIQEVLSLCDSPSQLSKEGEAYIATIQESVSKKFADSKIVSIIGPNYEARVVGTNDQYVTFVFSETYVGGIEEQPVAGVKFTGLDALLQNNGLDPAKQVQFFVVTKADYPLVDKMAAWVTNLFIGQSSAAIQKLTAGGFSQGKYRLVTDPQRCRSFIESVWPLAVLPRMDSAIMLVASEVVPNAFDQSGRPVTKDTPILAVSAYTDFRAFSAGSDLMMCNQNMRKFAPICVITGIYSRLCAPAIATTGLALATFAFIRRGCWLKPFTQFAVKGSPDIGNLITDQKQRPVHAASMNDINLILENHLTTKLPNLAIDIQIGTPFIPILKDLCQNMGHINAVIDSFTGGNAATSIGKTWQMGVYRFDGAANIVKDGVSTRSDTRCVDYLQLIASGAPVTDASSFLQPYMDAKVLVTMLKHFYNKAELLYLTNRIILNPAWVDAIMRALDASLKLEIEGAVDPNTYDIGSLTGFQPMGAGMMPFVSGSVGGFGSFYF